MNPVNLLLFDVVAMVISSCSAHQLEPNSVIVTSGPIWDNAEHGLDNDLHAPPVVITFRHLQPLVSFNGELLNFLKFQSRYNCVWRKHFKLNIPFQIAYYKFLFVLETYNVAFHNILGIITTFA